MRICHSPQEQVTLCSDTVAEWELQWCTPTTARPSMTKEQILILKVISRGGAIQGELILTLIQSTRILQEKKASPSKYINAVTHRVTSRTKALTEQTTCKLIAAGTVPAPPPELGAGQVP